MASTPLAQKQVNIRVEDDVFKQLEARARTERRSIPQTVRLLLSDALNAHGDGAVEKESDIEEYATLASAGGAIDWVSEEPELYTSESGEML